MFKEHEREAKKKVYRSLYGYMQSSFFGCFPRIFIHADGFLSFPLLDVIPRPRRDKGIADGFVIHLVLVVFTLLGGR